MLRPRNAALVEASGARSRAIKLLGLPHPYFRPGDDHRRIVGQAAGIAFNEHTDADGAVVFRHAWRIGLEGIVSKQLAAPYRSGPLRDWIKVKNPESPAMNQPSTRLRPPIDCTSIPIDLSASSLGVGGYVASPGPWIKVTCLRGSQPLGDCR
jgi:hypothetical protein